MRSYRRYQGKRKNPAKTILRVLLAVVLVCVLVFAGLLTAVLAGEHDDLAGDPKIMIVLGYQLEPNGECTILLRDRLDTALAYWEAHPDMTIVVTGGLGSESQPSEADAMADYLLARGVPEENILREDRATNTWENMLYSYDLLIANGYEEEMDKVIVVSNGFHLTRARMLFGRAWGEDHTLSTLAAPSSHVPTMLLMHLREPLALANSILNDRR